MIKVHLTQFVRIEGIDKEQYSFLTEGVEIKESIMKFKTVINKKVSIELWFPHHMIKMIEPIKGKKE